MNDRQRRRFDISGLIIAVGLAVLALVLRIDASRMQAAPAYARIGPEAAPNVVALGLLVLAAATAFAAWRGLTAKAEPADWPPVLIILGGLIGLILIIAFGGGFILASAVLFAATSRAFGRQALAVDFAIGFILALVTYLAFAKLLALSLPSGPLENLL
ncbi:tripartite tricarboxylate transporter TctB family protein [Chelatococcus sp. GCM10030263]|uniref:tripartite tricarboxylate transporter TctB family protein n=1 Tax=Chelatococcus sp. GCM10030263 TaxID=3273387 RepID=UPI00360E74AB